MLWEVQFNIHENKRNQTQRAVSFVKIYLDTTARSVRQVLFVTYAIHDLLPNFCEELLKKFIHNRQILVKFLPV